GWWARRAGGFTAATSREPNEGRGRRKRGPARPRRGTTVDARLALVSGSHGHGPPHRLRQRREPAARSGSEPLSRDRRATLAWRDTRPARAPTAHGEPAPRRVR